MHHVDAEIAGRLADQGVHVPHPYKQRALREGVSDFVDLALENADGRGLVSISARFFVDLRSRLQIDATSRSIEFTCSRRWPQS